MSLSIPNQQDELSKEQIRNSRLEAVAYLRASQNRNNERLCQVDSILSQAGGYTKNLSIGYQNKIPTEEEGYNTTKKQIAVEFESSNYLKSLFYRTIIALFLVLGIYIATNIATNIPNEKAAQIITLVKEQISIDHSEKLFDFMQDLSYTF